MEYTAAYKKRNFLFEINYTFVSKKYSYKYTTPRNIVCHRQYDIPYVSCTFPTLHIEPDEVRKSMSGLVFFCMNAHYNRFSKLYCGVKRRYFHQKHSSFLI